MPHFGRGMRWQDTGRGGTLYYPIWLSYAAALLDKYYQIKLVDAPAWNWDKKDVLKDIEKFKPELIIIDSSFPSLNNDVKIAEYIKGNYNSKIVLVGPPGSQFPDKILQSHGVDIVTRYEYDFTLKELAERLDSSQEISSVKGYHIRKMVKSFIIPRGSFPHQKTLKKYHSSQKFIRSISTLKIISWEAHFTRKFKSLLVEDVHFNAHSAHGLKRSWGENTG